MVDKFHCPDVSKNWKWILARGRQKDLVFHECISDTGMEAEGSYHSPSVLSQTVGVFLPTPITHCFVSYEQMARKHICATVLLKTMQLSSFEVLTEV
jgi:hypothetical protein